MQLHQLIQVAKTLNNLIKDTLMQKKQYVTMKTMQSGGYKTLETMNYRFAAITQLFSEYLRPGELVDWFSHEKRGTAGTECINIRKERGAIALYDLWDEFCGEVPYSIIPDLDKRFEMSSKNFAEIIYQWEELRVSRPDIILVVIHEDNHVSLETDPVIIKEYQDAGYAFNINKV